MATSSARPSRKHHQKPKLLRGRRIGIVGLGLIGGSLARRLASYKNDLHILGYDRDESLKRRTRQFCQWSASLADIVQKSDLLVLAVPVPAIIKLIDAVADHARSRVSRRRLLVTDVGTTKSEVHRAARDQRSHYDYLGMHPLAGLERAGWVASDAQLFVDKPIVYFPESTDRHVGPIRELINLLGGNPVRMNVQQHDRIVALTIGLPHILAYAASGLASVNDLRQDHLFGASWASLSRVASSDVSMVGGFLSTNAAAQLAVLEQLRKRLAAVERDLRRSQGVLLRRKLRNWSFSK